MTMNGRLHTKYTQYTRMVALNNGRKRSPRNLSARCFWDAAAGAVHLNHYLFILRIMKMLFVPIWQNM